jgi:hypothetical protein
MTLTLVSTRERDDLAPGSSDITDPAHQAFAFTTANCFDALAAAYPDGERIKPYTRAAADDRAVTYVRSGVLFGKREQ